MSAVVRPNWLYCILCIIIFYLTVLNLILNQFLYHFKIPCFIIFNSLFLLLWMIISLLCKALWITTVYEMCFINKLALPCLINTNCQLIVNSLDNIVRFYSFCSILPTEKLLLPATCCISFSKAHPYALIYPSEWEFLRGEGCRGPKICSLECTFAPSLRDN